MILLHILKREYLKACLHGSCGGASNLPSHLRGFVLLDLTQLQFEQTRLHEVQVEKYRVGQVKSVNMTANRTVAQNCLINLTNHL